MRVGKNNKNDYEESQTQLAPLLCGVQSKSVDGQIQSFLNDFASNLPSVGEKLLVVLGLVFLCGLLVTWLATWKSCLSYLSMSQSWERLSRKY